MKRSIAITVLSISIGLPTSVGVTEVCANKFDQEWAKKVLDIKNWNAKHPEYVKAHNLTRDMSKQTASLKRAMKALEVMCSQADSQIESSSIFVPNPHSLMLSGEAGDNQYYVGETIDILPAYATTVIGQEPYPDYPSFNRPLESEVGPYPIGGGWFAGGGYIPVGYPTHPVAPGGPGTGIVPTPEPSTISLLAIGIAAGIWKVSRA